MDVSIIEARAPWVEFKVIEEEDRNATIEAGAYRTRDVEYAVITPAGSKDRIECEVTDWLDRKRQDARAGRIPPEWVRSWEFAYKEWKEGRALPVNGTPVLTWPPISPSQRTALISMKVMTVEDLAECNEEVISRLGMGGRRLKQLAVDWLRTSKVVGTVAVELNAMREQLAALERQNKALTEQNNELRAQLESSRSDAPAPTAAEPASFLDDDNDGGNFVSDTPDQLRQVANSALGRKL